MNLREYLFYNKITMYKFSEMCGVSYNWIYNIKNGTKTASPKLANKIEELTHGIVKAETLVNKNENHLGKKHKENKETNNPKA